MATPTVSSPRQRQSSAEDTTVKWIVAGGLVFVAIVGYLFAGRITGPIEGLVTQQACSRHSSDQMLFRPVSEYEHPGRFLFLTTSEGTCTYGPIEIDQNDNSPEALAAEASAETAPERVEVSLADIEPGGLYGAMGVISFVLKLGAASTLVRLLADPLLDRFVR